MGLRRRVKIGDEIRIGDSTILFAPGRVVWIEAPPHIDIRHGTPPETIRRRKNRRKKNGWKRRQRRT